jgi:hypothetical protein
VTKFTFTKKIPTNFWINSENILASFTGHVLSYALSSMTLSRKKEKSQTSEAEDGVYMIEVLHVHI